MINSTEVLLFLRSQKAQPKGLQQTEILCYQHTKRNGNGYH